MIACKQLPHKESKLNALEHLKTENFINDTRIIEPTKMVDFDNYHKRLLDSVNKNYDLDLVSLFTKESFKSGVMDRGVSYAQRRKVTKVRAVPVAEAFEQVDQKRKEMGIYDNRISFAAYKENNYNPNVQLAIDDLTTDVYGNPIVYQTPREEVEARYSEVEQEMNRTDEFLKTLIEKLVSNLGMNEQDVVQISPEEAYEITKDTAKVWSNQPGFYYQGRIYLVKGVYDFRTVIHEFAHPLVRAISVDNEKLFNRIFEDLMKTPEGRQFYQEALEEYPDMAENNIVKEEAIVKALTLAAEQSGKVDPDNVPSKGFLAAIKKFFYALKQALRKVAKRDVKNLDENTTIKELADMLIDDSWNLNMSVPSTDEVVAFMENFQDINKGYQKAFADEAGKLGLETLISEGTTLALEQLQRIRNSKNKKELERVISDIRKGDNYLEAIVGELSKVSDKSTMERSYTKALDAIEEFKNRTNALSLNLIQLKSMTGSILDHVEVLKDSADQQDALSQVRQHIINVNQWDTYLNRTLELIEENSQLSSDDPIITQINTIQEDIRKIKQRTTSIGKEVLGDVLMEMYEPFAKQTNEEADIAIEQLREKLEKLTDKEGRRAREIKRRIKQHQAKKDRVVSREKMLDYAMGKMGDVGRLNAWIENYTSSNDPSIGSFAIYLKKNLSKAHTRTHAGYNEFAAIMSPLLKELGISPADFNKMGKTFLFLDKSYKRDEDENVVEELVYTYLNEFKDYKYAIAKMNDDIHNARLEHIEKRTDETLAKYIELVKAKNEHMRLFFKNEYVDEYYEADAKLKSTPVGVKAAGLRNELLAEIGMFQKTHDTDTELLEDYEVLDTLWEQYHNLYSLYDLDGNKKQGEDLEIAELLRAHREEMRDYHEYDLRQGDFDRAYNQFMMKQTLKLKDETDLDEDSQEFQDMLSERVNTWLLRNTRIKIKDKYYEDRAFILDQIQALLGDQDVNVKELYDMIYNSLEGRKDANGEVKGNDLSKKHQESLTKLHKKIEDAKKSAEKKKLTPEQRSDLNTLFGMLDKLQRRVATSHYIDKVNNLYSQAIQELGKTDYETFDQMSVDQILDPEFVEVLFDYEPFKEWFDMNHYEVKNNKGKVVGYRRSAAWDKIIPRDESYFESTDVFENGEKVATVPGVPAIKYYNRRVKDEYKTGYNKSTGEIELKVGEHIDNKGRWLPKSAAEMEVVKEKYNEDMLSQGPWDQYINHEYLEIKKEGGARYEALENIKEFHLKAQEGLDNVAKLGLEHPRFRMKRDEYIRSKGIAGDRIDKVKQAGEGVKQFFKKRSDDQEHGLNFSLDDMVSESTDYQSEDQAIPIRGKYKMEYDQVSTDVIYSLMRYYQSAEENKVLKEMQPVARAMQELAGKNNPADLNKIKQNTVKGLANRILPQGKTNRRKQVIDSMVEIFFEGQNYFQKQNDIGEAKFINTAMGMASHSFFAMDITSAAKNFFGAQYQIALEATTGKYYSYKSWQMGRPWALKAQGRISLEIYKDTPKSLEVQIVEVFDAIQGRFEEKFGESMSRSFGRDLVNGNWLTSHRKFMENEATLQIFSAIMHDTWVDQIQPDGKPKKIRYIKAWELDPETKNIKLKEGIDPKWDIDGSEFERIKFRNQEVSNFLQGAYSKFDQPMMNRHMWWKMLASMKKFFTKMAIHRIGHTGSIWRPQEKINMATAEMHMGYYLTNLRMLTDVIRTGGVNLLYLTPEEKRAFRKSVVEIIKIAFMGYAFMWLWGFDEDDPDKWKKIRERSGALPTPFTDEEFSANWNIGGWLGNHMLLLSMQTEAENIFFVPFPGYGLKDMINTLNPSSIAMQGSIGNTVKLIEQLSLWMRDDDRAYYKNDVGALNIQQQGESKYWKTLYKMIGAKGKFIDPATNIKNTFTARQR